MYGAEHGQTRVRFLAVGVFTAAAVVAVFVVNSAYRRISRGSAPWHQERLASAALDSGGAWSLPRMETFGPVMPVPDESTRPRWLENIVGTAEGPGGPPSPATEDSDDSFTLPGDEGPVQLAAACCEVGGVCVVYGVDECPPGSRKVPCPCYPIPIYAAANPTSPNDLTGTELRENRSGT